MATEDKKPQNDTEEVNDQELEEILEKKKKPEDKSKKSKAETEKLRKELEKAEEKIAETEDKYLRVAAEYDNFRRRSKEEKDGIYSDAKADAIKELLPLIDNLERAKGFTSAEKVAEGLEMILGTLPDVLAKLGITEFGEKGEKFDPNIHSAIMHVEDESLGEGEIVEVFQKGYRIGDKIIRYAMVQVAN